MSLIFLLFKAQNYDIVRTLVKIYAFYYYSLAANIFLLVNLIIQFCGVKLIRRNGKQKGELAYISKHDDKILENDSGKRVDD